MVESLRKVIVHADVHGEDRIEPSALMAGGCRGISGVALYTAYRLRNALAHGSINLPEHPALGNIDPNEIFVHVANRSFLLSAQMLLLAGLKSGRLRINGLRDEDYTGEWARAAYIDPINAISKLHLRPTSEHECPSGSQEHSLGHA